MKNIIKIFNDDSEIHSHLEHDPEHKAKQKRQYELDMTTIHKETIDGQDIQVQQKRK